MGGGEGSANVEKKIILKFYLKNPPTWIREGGVGGKRFFLLLESTISLK